MEATALQFSNDVNAHPQYFSGYHLAEAWMRYLINKVIGFFAAHPHRYEKRVKPSQYRHVHIQVVLFSALLVVFAEDGERLRFVHWRLDY